MPIRAHQTHSPFFKQVYYAESPSAPPNHSRPASDAVMLRAHHSGVLSDQILIVDVCLLLGRPGRNSKWV